MQNVYERRTYCARWQLYCSIDVQPTPKHKSNPSSFCSSVSLFTLPFFLIYFHSLFLFCPRLSASIHCIKSNHLYRTFICIRKIDPRNLFEPCISRLPDFMSCHIIATMLLPNTQQTTALDDFCKSLSHCMISLSILIHFSELARVVDVILLKLLTAIFLLIFLTTKPFDHSTILQLPRFIGRKRFEYIVLN